MKRLIALLTWIGLAVAWAAPSHSDAPAAPPGDPKLLEHAEVEYYDVSGSTPDELRVSMNERRPTNPFDAHRAFDAYTDWYISWDWPGYGSNACNLAAALVTYEIQVILPGWQPPGNASPELITKWEKYIHSLVIHEQGHVDHIVNHYLDVETAIRNATCATAEAAAQRVLVDLRAFDLSYDRETNHGETQGAVFP